MWSQTSDEDSQDGVFFARGTDPDDLVASTSRLMKDKTLYNAGYDGAYVFNVGYDAACDVFYLTTWSATGEEQPGACLIEGETGLSGYAAKVASGGFGRAAALLTTRDDSVEAPWFAEFDLATGVLDAEPMDLVGLIDPNDLASGYTEWVLVAGHGGWVLTWVNVDDGRTVNLIWLRRGVRRWLAVQDVVTMSVHHPAPMSILRTSRLELRLTPAQKALIGRGAAVRQQTLSEYVVEALVEAALRDTASGVTRLGSLGWMRGTATLDDEPVGPTE